MSQVIHQSHTVFTQTFRKQNLYVNIIGEWDTILGNHKCRERRNRQGQRGSKFKVVHYCKLFFRAVCLVTCDSLESLDIHAEPLSPIMKRESMQLIFRLLYQHLSFVALIFLHL